MPGSQALRELGGLAMEQDCRAATRFAPNLHVAPTDTAFPAGTDGLERGFFRREAGSIALGPVGLGIAIANFGFREHASQKPPAEALQSCSNARHFRNVNSRADDHKFDSSNSTAADKLVK